MNATKDKRPKVFEYGQSPQAIECRKLARVLLDASAWRDPNPDDPENNQHAERGRPTAEWRQAMDAFLESWTDPLALPYANSTVQQLSKSWKRLNDNLSESDNGPTRNDWALLDSVLIAMDDALPRVFADPPTIKPRRSPTQQHRDGATLRTIALELRWYDDNGHPDTDRVERELDVPGSEWTPAEVEARKQYDLQQLGFALPPEEIARLSG